LVALGKNVNIKLFLVVSPHMVLFRFEAKYKPDLKLNLDMGPDLIKRKTLGPDPGLGMSAVPYSPGIFFPWI
jgi:hypothetical protein